MPKAIETEYGSDSKYGHRVGPFGASEYCTVKPQPSEKERLTQAHRLAWSHGCPNPTSCIEEYGLDYMIQRYNSCNNALLIIVLLSEDINLSLHNQLIRPAQRLPGEPMGKHEPLAVPNSHQERIAMGAGLYGYALPRLLLLGENPTINPVNRLRNMEVTYSTLYRNLVDARDPDKLLAGLARDLSFDTRLEREKILAHILPQCILEEENCHSTYDRFAKVLIDKASDLAKLYTELTPSQKAELEIAEVPALR